MDRIHEHPETLTTNENPYPTIEQELAKHPGYTVVRDFADDGGESGAVRSEIQAVLLGHWKNRRWAYGTTCRVSENENRYVIFAEPERPGTNNILGGIAINRGQPWPRINR